jgi:hypothetical protein
MKAEKLFLDLVQGPVLPFDADTDFLEEFAGFAGVQDGDATPGPNYHVLMSRPAEGINIEVIQAFDNVVHE